MRRKARDPSDGSAVVKPLLSCRRELLLTTHPQLPRDISAHCQTSQGDGDDVSCNKILVYVETTKDSISKLFCTPLL